jgi:hypothetical protein
MLRLLITILAGGLGLVSSMATAQVALTENQARASFVLNFARYVEWPAAAFPTRESPVTICLLGTDSRGLNLADIAGRRIGERPIEVRRIERLVAVEGCHVAYLADSERRQMAAHLQALGARPILTVGDVDGFIDIGGMIGLLRANERLQFEINRDALQVAGLKASAHLLRLARNLAPGGGR